LGSINSAPQQSPAVPDGDGFPEDISGDLLIFELVGTA
jgi:hypothetical protein